tara:strand:+ start:240 stop:689 length:450 start_codon:yes stop_codon:yes gene_type:complete
MKLLVILTLIAFLIPQLKANENLSISQFVSKIPLWEVYPNSSPKVIGDNGKAYGFYQITSIMVSDYNRIANKNLVHEDCFDPKLSQEIAYTVLSHYSNYIKRLGEEPTVKHWLFIWNGGGGAWRRVHSPINDRKQLRLEAYAKRAMTFL